MIRCEKFKIKCTKCTHKCWSKSCFNCQERGKCYCLQEATKQEIRHGYCKQFEPIEMPKIEWLFRKIFMKGKL